MFQSPSQPGRATQAADLTAQPSVPHEIAAVPERCRDISPSGRAKRGAPGGETDDDQDTGVGQMLWIEMQLLDSPGLGGWAAE
ncbi:uncharacterized protein N7482_001786 [Penicillium canariense]|uniref:Uncharacterized protein n=1 Tax=Penicillium canariense TaxID=189055 RepID=A0A9W9LU85_9EURO|nr:uncharacterized protein N7482_001786 [Penicillium canariense]KAJ5175909.1 hypothetical protein N7482_001786 [Penicillium canariense]